MKKTVLLFSIFGIYFTFPLLGQNDSLYLSPIEIVGEKQEAVPTQSNYELKGAELEKTRGLSLGESLKEIPGVSTLQTGPTIVKPVIQGMFGQRVLILNNGVRQEGQQWGSEHAPEIDPFVAQKLTVIRGASSVRYGSDAIGGVILIEPKSLRTEAGIGGNIFLGGFSNSRGGASAATIDFSPAKIPGLSGRIQGSLRKAGNFKTPNYYLKNTGLEEYNFSYTLGYSKKRYGAEIFYSQFNTKVGILSASHIGNLTDLKAAIASDTPLETSGFDYAIERPMQKVVHELLKTHAYYIFNNGAKLSATYAFQYNERSEFDKHNTISNSADKESPELELHISTHTANISYDHLGKKNFNTVVGLSGVAQGNISLGRMFIPNFKSYAGGVFLMEQWKKGRWKVEGGVRYDYKWIQAYYYKNSVYQEPEFNFNNLSGSLGLVYGLSKHIHFHSNIGTGFRPPHVSELFSNGLHHGAASVEIGNDKLGSEQAYTSSLAADINYKKITGGVNFYSTYIHNYIYLSPVFPATLTIRGAFPTFQYTQVEATFTGLDYWVSDTIGKHIAVSTKGSIIRAYNKTIGERLILTPPTRLVNGVSYQLHWAKRLQKPYIGLSIPIVFRKSNLPDSSDYLEAPKGYVLLEASAGFSVKVGKSSTMDLYFLASNLTNKVYRDYLDRFRYYADALGRNYSIKIKLNF